MSDTTTELEVLDQIVEVLGGQSGQHETVVPTLQQILALLGGEGGDGYNPSLSVGRADALTGADSTAQWMQRESEGTGSATVRSVQGAAVVWNQLYRPSFNAGTYGGLTVSKSDDGTITFNGKTGATGTVSQLYVTVNIPNGHKFLMVGNPSVSPGISKIFFVTNTDGNDTYGTGTIHTKSSAGNSVAFGFYAYDTMPTADNVTFRPQVFDLTAMFGSGNEPATVAEFEAMYPEAYYPYSAPTLKPVQIAGIQSKDALGAELDSVEWTAQTLRAAGTIRDELTAGELVTRVGERAYQSGDESDASVRTDGTTTYYPLATPTTTPISPALPMTYKVQQGGTESIIVPEGEISAIPVLTIAEGESATDVVMDALACIAAPDGPTATANHAQNTYLTMGGKLYKVTSAIAVGETITAGTNVSETTVMSELLALTA